MATTLLLVEDDEPLASILTAHLRARGYDVVHVATVESARDRLASGIRIDLVILDINLPGETGWSLLRAPAMDAAGRPPVVLASAMSVSPARLREYGVAGFLPKPFALETLRATIDRLTSTEDRDA